MTNETPQTQGENPENPVNPPRLGMRRPPVRTSGSPRERTDELKAMMQDAQSEGDSTEQFAQPPTGATRADAHTLPEATEQVARFGGVMGQDAQPIEGLTVQDAPSGKRKKDSPGQILARSPHQEEYRRLMKAGWTSFALERYADYRYGEKIASSTFRNFKARKLARDPKWLDVTYLTDKDGQQIIAKGVEVDLDVMGVRQQLLHLQLQRISIDVAEELGDRKLKDGTAKELRLAMDMLDKVREDQVQYGILPATASVTRFTIDDLPADVAPRHSTLGDALGVGSVPPMDLAKAARTLGELIPITKNQNRTA